MDESQSSRRIINYGAHQSSLLQDSYHNLNMSSSHQFDQKFDQPNPTIYDQRHSQQVYPQNLYGQGLYSKTINHATHSQVISRSQTEIVHEHNQFQARRYESNRGGEVSTGRSPAKQVQITGLSTGRSDIKPNTGSQGQLPPYQNTVEVNNRKVDLEPILSQSQKFEESVKDPGRMPQRIGGLTEFLVNQHFKRLGVFSKKEITLFEFWKKYISGAYKQKREKKHHNHQEGLCTCGFGDTLNQRANATFNHTKSAMSFKSQKSTKNVVDDGKENSVLNLYKKFEWCYEMDVRFTIQKDLEEEHDEYKKNQLSQHFEYESKSKKEIQIKEQREIESMLKEFYQHLKEYTISEAKEKFDRERRKQESRRSMVGPDWHKRQATETNPIESIEEEPKKPTINSSNNQTLQSKDQPLSNSELEKEKQRIEKEIERESNFIQNLMYMVRNDDKLTNDPQELFLLYKNTTEKARLGIVWAKGDDDAQKLIHKFFQPEYLLKRFLILFSKKNKFNSQKNISYFGFYLQLKKRERLLNMIDKKYVYRNKEQNEGTMNSTVVSSIQEIIEEYELAERQLNYERHQMTQEDELAQQVRNHKKVLKAVFGKDKAKQLEKDKNEKEKNRIEELAKPKDKWKRGRKLLELQKKFPHDMVLQKMIKEEFKENRVFKYPEEYDVYDDELEQAFKVREAKTIKVKDLSQGKVLREKFAQMDGQALYYARQEMKEVRAQQHELEQFILRSVQTYLEQKKNRLQGLKQTLREYLSSVYHNMVKQFKQLAEQRFQHITYGTKKSSETYKKSFPTSFKRYFFKLLKSFVRTEKGLKRLKHAPPTFMIPGGKRCTIHQFGCPEDCQFATLNKKILLRTTLHKKRQREPGGYRSRVWRRRDYREQLREVLMTNSELYNCTFEPEAGSMNQNIQTAFEANKNLKESEYFKEPDPEAYFSKLGKNFESSHPEVYKLGVLKRAKLKYLQGNYDEAMNALSEGFNIESIRKRFDPNYMKRFMAEMLLKKKHERQEKEKQEAEKQGSAARRVFLQKDEHESQKKRPEEDFENKKLVPILREAYDLLITIEKKKHDAEKQIKRIKKQQTSLKGQLTVYSDLKKSQTQIDISSEKILFRTIMCPLRDKCDKIMKPRWPTSNIKSFTKFGEHCPYAHHPMELNFPESIITSYSANLHRIKSLEKSIISEEPKVFKPAGRLFDCVGCNQSSGNHIGGPCNLCRYQKLADLESNKFVDKKRKESLMRSMERRESVDIKRERSEMSKVRIQLNLDENYTRKFGLLKKACVLYFYGRYNDAFDEIAKAAGIIKNQKEIEVNKQKIIEKRWKFKLGLNDDFRLPMPIEKIDPNQVDEKFIKKLNIQGVAHATIKLYIEQVSPVITEEYSKHQFLNKCIEEFYQQCEDAIDDKLKTISKMKKQVRQLDADAMAELEEANKTPPEQSPEKGETLGTTNKAKKKKKTKMCPEQLEKGFCHIVSDKHTTKVCPFAHNPIELDLIPAETKMKNLNGVIHSQTVKMKNMKPLEPWKPAKAGDIEHTHLMDMTTNKKTIGKEEDDDDLGKSKKQKTIFERDNLFRKPYERVEQL